MTEYTSRLALPYPDENDVNWWAIEAATDGRMDMLDKLLCAALEATGFVKDTASPGYFDLNASTNIMTVNNGDNVYKSSSGGQVTFAHNDTATVNDGDWFYFIPTSRPVSSSQSGTLLAGTSVDPSLGAVIVGRRVGTKIAFMSMNYR